MSADRYNHPRRNPFALWLDMDVAILLARDHARKCVMQDELEHLIGRIAALQFEQEERLRILSLPNESKKFGGVDFCPLKQCHAAHGCINPKDCTATKPHVSVFS